MNRLSYTSGRLMLVAAVLSASLVALSYSQAEEPAAAAAASTQPSTQPSTQASTQPSSNVVASYAIGRNFGDSLKQAPVSLDNAAVLRGVIDALEGKQAEFTDAQVQTAMMEIQQQLMMAQQKEMEEAQAKEKAMAVDNIAAGKAFLENNSKVEGVKTTGSGLQYQIIKEGEGASPKPTDMVKVHYTGTLIDGTKFDSSVDRGEPAEFPLDQVIKGWTEGLQYLKVGGKAKLWIPSELAYGDRAAGPIIKPGSTLVFEVELLEIAPAPAEAQPGR
jgi:FKBP-type peptidyl-prolyl cis-trans isomerase